MSVALPNSTNALSKSEAPPFEANLHIVQNSFSYPSRILKQTEGLIGSRLVKQVFIIAAHSEGMLEHQDIDSHRSVWRIRLKTRTWPKILLTQMFKYLEYSGRIIAFARRKNIQLINVHHVSLLPLGFVLKVLCRAKLVYDTHELETETYELGFSKLRKTVAKVLERIFIRFADLILVVSDSIGDWYRNTYRLSNVATVLNCPKFQEIASSNRLREELSIPQEKRIVLYQGGLAIGRGIEGLLEAFAKRDDERHVLICMGYGELEGMVKDHASAHPNIYFQPAAKPAEVLTYTASANIGVSYIDNPSLNDAFCLPNKLFEYIMAGLPVIVNNAKEQRALVEKKKIGVVLSDLTSDSMAAALSQIDSMDPKALEDRLKEATEEFSWSHQEKAMIAAYKTKLLNLKD